MSLHFEYLCLQKECAGIVVRPRTAAGPQTLVFLSDAIHELLLLENTTTPNASGAGNGPTCKAFRLREQGLPTAGRLLEAPSSPVYEPTSDSVLFVSCEHSIMRLDANNTISLVVGGIVEEDVPEEEAQLYCISQLAPDGKGNVFLAVGNGLTRIWMLRIATGEIVSLPGSEPRSGTWKNLVYDTATDVLVAATSSAVCHVPLYGSRDGGRDGGLAAGVRLVAGSWEDGQHSMDGDGAAARFCGISALVAGADRSLYIREERALRVMDAFGAVETTVELDVLENFIGWMSILSGGELATYNNQTYEISIISCSSSIGFTPGSEVLAGRRLAPQTAAAGGGDGGPQLLQLLEAPAASSEGSGSTANPIVTVRLADGKSILLHRSVLAARSEYFKQRLATGGGFVDSGVDEISLEDADPQAFRQLVSYLYGGDLKRVPRDLWLPVAKLADMFLMRVESGELKERLLETVTAATVVSDLVWAEQYNGGELVPELLGYLLRHRKEVVAAGPQVQAALVGLAAVNPARVAEVVLALAAV